MAKLSTKKLHLELSRLYSCEQLSDFQIEKSAYANNVMFCCGKCNFEGHSNEDTNVKLDYKRVIYV